MPHHKARCAPMERTARRSLLSVRNPSASMRASSSQTRFPSRTGFILHPRPCASFLPADFTDGLLVAYATRDSQSEYSARDSPTLHPRPCAPFPREHVSRQFHGRTSAPARSTRCLPPISRMGFQTLRRLLADFAYSSSAPIRAISSRTRFPPVSRTNSAAVASGFRLFLFRAHARHFLARAFSADFANGQRGDRARISLISRPRPYVPSPRARAFRRFLGRTSAPARRARRRDRQPRPWRGRWE